MDHYNCYLKERPDLATEKIGFFDLEASNLDADYGQMLSYCIKDSSVEGEGGVLSGVLNKRDIFDTEPGFADKRIVSQCVRDLQEFDKVVTFYGARFDLPFLRTRAMVCGVEFPNYGALNHKDLWFTVRGKFKLSSNRLENACRVLLGKSDKTRINPRAWHGAIRGDEESLEYVLEHNIYDVLDLERLYMKVIDFSRPQCGSI